MKTLERPERAPPTPPKPPARSAYADAFGDTPKAKKRMKRLRRLDALIATAIRAGGIGIILAVFGIFAFVFGEALPLFLPSEAEPEATSFALAPGAGAPLAIGVDAYREAGYALTDAGNLALFDLEAARRGEPASRVVPLENAAGATIRCGARAGNASVVAAGTADGRVLLARIRFAPVYEDGRRVAQTQEVSWQQEVELREDGGPIEHVALSADDERFTVVAAAPGFLGAAAGKFEGGRVRKGDASAALLNRRGAPSALAVNEEGDGFALGTSDGRILRFALDRAEAELLEDLDAEPRERVTLLGYAFGSQSLLCGTESGGLAAYQGLRSGPNTARSFVRVREFPPLPAAPIAFAPSARGKGFLIGAADGSARMDHLTTERTVVELGRRDGLAALAFAPKGDGALLSTADGRLESWTIEAHHADVSLSALFLPTLYEGYDQPELTWQSTGGSDDYEPKTSLVPLIFGSLKGVLYSMLFSVPLSILAAMFVSQFATPRVRGFVKPAVELMGALPSVVIGFLAGLWLSPLVDRHLLETLSLLIVVPLALPLAGFAYLALPNHLRTRHLYGRELLFLAPFLAAGVLLGVWVASPLESGLFDGAFKRWMIETFSVQYDPRNALVVGAALGFAVVPIIFTVAEDAMSNVPRALRAASEALGASRWQTAWRLVLPAASPGIFAAVMLGFGRAVGETMIVVMATGNTPILDLSPWNGMRTISACIATEIPEAPVDSSLYRVLFLAGAILFLFAFLCNTTAELVGAGLRRRYGKW